MKAKFPNLYFLVFVTELWHLTGCKGIAVNTNLNYTVTDGENGEQYIFSTERFAHYNSYFKKLGAVGSMKGLGSAFKDMKVKDPLFGKEINVCVDLELNSVFGSGIKAVCPAHVIDDHPIAEVIFEEILLNLSRDLVFQKRAMWMRREF